MGSCLFLPCVFLILGGQLLNGLFPDAWSPSTWTIFMALMVLPVCLIPTLKEGSAAAFAGCFGTILADIFGVALVMHGMRGHPAVPFPDLKFEQVANMFGNLSLAYGAGIIIPDLQRQHSDPSRMPRIVGVTVIFISCLFLILSTTAYSAVGCQISGNLLFTIYPDSETNMTSLGFKPKWGLVVLAYLFMQLHITIAFSVIINPAFFIAERLVLGMHKKKDNDMDHGFDFDEHTTPTDNRVNPPARSSKTSFHSDHDFMSNRLNERAEYTGVNVFKYIALRITIVVILVVIAIVFKDDFANFADFVGASCLTMNCILLPIIFYFMKAWANIPIYEKVAGGIVVVVCSVLGCYVSYTTGKHLLAPVHNDADFPYCASEFENTVYYNYTAVHET
ncbi:unnamed protein product [Peronospora belbahrii]|nr:unnamed protein product [Peronospora belbahrii]